MTVSQRSHTIHVPYDLDLNEDFQRALTVMNGNARCVFITGRAGTGKSTLLTYFVQNILKKVVVLASTGIAALRVRGQTIHSFFGFPPRIVTGDDIRAMRNRELYEALDTVIIDEVSMVRADLMDGIDQFLRINRNERRSPFGGVQVIFFGDLFQLPPVISGDDEGQYLSFRYASPYFFDAHVFSQVKMEVIELGKVYRQKNRRFITMLNTIREGRADNALIAKINERHGLPSQSEPNLVTLTTTNDRALTINNAKLAELPHNEFNFYGVPEGKYLQGQKEFPADLVLRLKKDAQVLFVKNDMKKRWVNGDIGTVVTVDYNMIEVGINRNNRVTVYPVEKETWEVIRYRFDYETGNIIADVVGTFTQYPLKLAWAITIHKSQGATFDRVHIDLGRGAFAHGQAYVALSRCRSLKGITLERLLRLSDIRVDGRIVHFFKKTLL
ncbi:MAG: DEAD/DEAH box helicase [Syntrophorhabdaceae bacterium]|nr:DEAD/DEAH box helicase [Syntrophorhabdaceae bacterium]MDD5242661.1 DEAD/DEAH box helicase [Syntrophorhabdaceae bacterium]